MLSGSQARWLAPIALAAALLAVAVVVLGASSGDEGEDRPAASRTSTGERGETTARRGGSTTATTATGASTTATTPAARSYTVKPDDTLGTISEETGVTVEELQELNPTVDPQSLTVGQKLRLAR